MHTQVSCDDVIDLSLIGCF